MSVFVAEPAGPGSLFIGVGAVAAFTIDAAVHGTEAEGGGLMPVGREGKTRLIVTGCAVLRYFALVGIAVTLAALRRGSVIHLGGMALFAPQLQMSLLQFKVGLAIMVKGQLGKERVFVTIAAGLRHLAFVLVFMASSALLVHSTELIVDVAVQARNTGMACAGADLFVLVAERARLKAFAVMAFATVVVQPAMLCINMAREAGFITPRIGAW